MSFKDTKKAQPAADRFTGLPIFMDDDHAQVHLGAAYALFRNGTVANNGTLDIELTTPSAPQYIHLKKYELAADGYPHIFTILEDPTLTTGSTTMASRNRLRTLDTPDDSPVVAKSNPTNVSGGTTIEQLVHGGGTGIFGTSSSNTRSTALEIVLKPDTTYILRSTNTGGTSATVSMWVYYYVEDAG